jgi:hypothetical protein
MTSTKLPSDHEIAAARGLLTRAAAASAQAPRAALIGMVTMPEYGRVVDAMRNAQTLNPADAEIAYTLSMLERLRITHAPD